MIETGNHGKVPSHFVAPTGKPGQYPAVIGCRDMQP
jgi:hypothetical protein